jgi:hypothetical protein
VHLIHVERVATRENGCNNGRARQDDAASPSIHRRGYCLRRLHPTIPSPGTRVRPPLLLRSAAGSADRARVNWTGARHREVTNKVGLPYTNSAGVARVLPRRRCVRSLILIRISTYQSRAQRTITPRHACRL